MTSEHHVKPIAWVIAAAVIAASIGGAVFVTYWTPMKRQTQGEAAFADGTARLRAGDATGAIDPLRAAVRLSTGASEREARWYLAVALERAGRQTDAIDTLEPLCRTPGARQQQACRSAERLRVR